MNHLIYLYLFLISNQALASLDSTARKLTSSTQKVGFSVLALTGVLIGISFAFGDKNSTEKAKLWGIGAFFVFGVFSLVAFFKSNVR